MTDADSGVAGGGEVGAEPPSWIDLNSLSLTERVMMWDRGASVVKERNPDVRAITERSTEEIAEVLRLTHDEGRNRRAIVDKSGELILQRAAQRAGHQVGQRLPFHPQVDWVSALARSQASVITEVSNACTKTARDLLK